MRFKDFSFGSIRIDGVTFEHDMVIDRGEISRVTTTGKLFERRGSRALVIEKIATQVRHAGRRAAISNKFRTRAKPATAKISG